MGNACYAPMAPEAASPELTVGLPAQKRAASPSVALIYYSTYGHVKVLAEEIKTGLKQTERPLDHLNASDCMSRRDGLNILNACRVVCG